MKNKIALFWFRRDLRLEDNHGLSQALASGHPVLPIFIFDPLILERLHDKKDRRVDYIFQALDQLREQLKELGSDLLTFHATPLAVFETLLDQYNVQHVFCNRDYEPEALARDTEIWATLQKKNIGFHAYKDQVIFDRKEVLKKDSTPYTVYTPYAKAWKLKYFSQEPYTYKMAFTALLPHPQPQRISWEQLGFERTDMRFVPPVLDQDIVEHYDQTRDFPAHLGTSHLGVALRFGTISIRKCVQFAVQHNTTWLSELIWREFFMQILYHFPQVVHQSFKKKYDAIAWRNNELEFEQWCAGQTGYPIVDAGMRELNATGFMHNRVRMITASFLCKHLLIDWRWGEAYFAQKLTDFDLSANNGNWQWVAGSGCDASPYFRVFNPELQTAKFDKQEKYIKKWVPEYQSSHYVTPIVLHKEARERALEEYKKAVNAAL